MADSSVIPVRRVDAARQDAVKPNAKDKEVDSQALPSISPAGPRKLIRPKLPADAVRYPVRRSARVTSTRNRSDAAKDSSHAEAYYLQKQIQTKTPMIFQLEDGERIAGVIEWYDLHVIKVRQGTTRTLIYKDGIKYLYKAADRVTGQP